MAGKIEWTNIQKRDQADVDCLEFEFDGTMFGWHIRMYESSIGGQHFWEALIRKGFRNYWSSGACESKQEAEHKLKIGLLLLPVCRIIGYKKKRLIIDSTGLI